MRVIVDFDGTITKEVKVNVKDSEPNDKVITKINKLHRRGDEITIFTSRGMLSQGTKEKAEKEFKEIIETFLDEWDVCYDKLIFGKVSGDLFVDDLSMNHIDFTKPSIYIAKFGKKYSIDYHYMKGVGNYEILGFVQIFSQFCNVFLGGEFEGDISKYNNVYKYDDKYAAMIDYCLLDNGLMRGQKVLSKYTGIEENLKISDTIIKQALDINRPILFSLTDPRLNIPESFDELKRNMFILHQNNFTDIDMKMFRGHQEKLCLLSLPFVQTNEQRGGVCVMCRSDKYRDVIYQELINKWSFEKIYVYGNKEFENAKYMGLLENNEIYKAYIKHSSCFCVPIEKGWLTQKAVECIHFNCLPILHETYDEKRLMFKEKSVSMPKMKEQLLMWYRLDSWVNYYKKVLEKVEE